MSSIDRPIHVAAIVGSLRRESLNRRLFNATDVLAPASMTFSQHDIGSLPHFNAELEHEPAPSILELREAVGAADALLIVSPEYNYSIPGVLKNALDWLSRPPGRSVLAHKPAAIMGAASGRSGTMRAQLHLRQILTAVNMVTVSKPEVYVPSAAEKFDESGHLLRLDGLHLGNRAVQSAPRLLGARAVDQAGAPQLHRLQIRAQPAHLSLDAGPATLRTEPRGPAAAPARQLGATFHAVCDLRFHLFTCSFALLGRK